ncbi:hypothetical protein LIER_41891 [Lithospermum erythrorhizon]|uniref:Uncharacterized protein n=1 Tax=Lithospermum erythrorhizon TaxID=34254 RepID=A0AAV3RFW6_LITER
MGNLTLQLPGRLLDSQGISPLLSLSYGTLQFLRRCHFLPGDYFTDGFLLKAYSKLEVAHLLPNVCCSEIETIRHVFFNNTIATNVWKYFAEIFGVSKEKIVNIQQAIKLWSLSCPTKGYIRQIVPVIILWVLWEARNKQKHEGRVYSFQLIQKRIHNIILNIGRTELQNYSHWKGNLYVAVSLNITVLHHKKKRPQVLHWIRPPSGKLKLNREQNAAPDWIAKEARNSRQEFFWEHRSMHKKLKAVVMLEQGIPYIRG